MSDTEKDVAQVLGRIPSGIFVLTCGDGQGQFTGMLCSWVQQAGFRPPTITLAIQQDRYVNSWLADSRRAVLNVVGESEKHLLTHFGRGFKADEPAFQGLETRQSATGLPVIADAIGYLDLELRQQMPAGDHTIYLFEVTGAGCGESLHEEQPMIHIRKSGLHY